MKKTGVALWCSWLVLLVALSVTADTVEDLQAATVPVADQGAPALAGAAREALAEVLVKVSGTRELLQNPTIVEALADARNHVQQYAYVSGKAPGEGLSVRFEFDAGYIRDLVTRAGAPLWTANRPLVLAWVVVEDEQGRHFINWESTPEQAQLLADEFSRRGVPVQLPVFDLVDTAAVAPEDVWRLDAGAVQAASTRYNVQDVVVARLASPAGAQATGDWSYLYQDRRVNSSVTAPDLQAFLRDGVNVVAATMSARYAVAPTAAVDGGVRMSVAGVSSYTDYAAIVSWLEGLELVQYANLERVQGDRIELRLQAQADAAQLAAIIELNNRFELLPLPVSGSTAQLNYQWRN
ncbi:MAG: DUF2066 domain-containing protein [Halioglobus sp.]